MASDTIRSFSQNLYEITFAEMDMEEKNRISHRSKALEKMKEILVPYLKKENI